LHTGCLHHTLAQRDRSQAGFPPVFRLPAIFFYRHSVSSPRPSLPRIGTGTLVGGRGFIHPQGKRPDDAAIKVICLLRISFFLAYALAAMAVGFLQTT
jgi:hypothetical protein